MDTKQQILKAIEELPDDASVEDALERLYLLYKIERGLKQAQWRTRHSGRGSPTHVEMAEVKWAPHALDDREAICLFIARDAPQVAVVFAQSAFRATDRLADFPRSGRVVPELHDQNFREIILGNYRLI